MNLDLETFKVRRFVLNHEESLDRALYKNLDLGNTRAAEVDHGVISIECNLTMFQALGKIVDLDQEQQRAEDVPLRNANLNWS